MKASRYVKAFEKEVDHWERKLSHILEVVEMILQVQRQWMYLEVSYQLTVSLRGYMHVFVCVHAYICDCGTIFNCQ